MGSPVTLKDAEFDALRAQSGLQALPAVELLKVANGRTQVALDLPRQGVALLVLAP
jgi:hypothetical protein